MSGVKHFYQKYFTDFRKLEEYSADLYSSDPMEYENWEERFPRSGVVKKGHWEYVFGAKHWVDDPPVVASLDRKLKIDAFWEQRDKLDNLLKEDEEFQQWMRGKSNYKDYDGMAAFYLANFFARKHTIYSGW